MSHKNKRVVARYRAIDRVAPADVLTMYSIFCRYYDNADLATFLRDMSRKTGVFLLTNTDRQIVGFSTVALMDLDIGSRRIKGVFSGDTIIEREYWGSRALPLAFFLYLVRVVVRHPLTPVFWLLISKGYKTYLLMANNFFRFYPHPEQRYQKYAELIPKYCEELFPGYYDSARGILDFGNEYQKLRGDVAPITDHERDASATIRFFEQCNPEWQRGTELPCVGRAGFPDAFRYLFRYLGKVWRRSAKRSVATQQQTEEAVQEPPARVVEVPVKVIKARAETSPVTLATRSAQ
ncbi:MAG: hypothetical protein ACK4SX_12045 [Alcanivoracaceae bacterium]